jgi:hypothetical protein
VSGGKKSPATKLEKGQKKREVKSKEKMAMKEAKEKNNANKKREKRDFTNAHIFDIVSSFDSIGESIMTAISNEKTLKKIWEKNVMFMNAHSKFHDPKDCKTDN